MPVTMRNIPTCCKGLQLIELVRNDIGRHIATKDIYGNSKTNRLVSTHDGRQCLLRNDGTIEHLGWRMADIAVTTTLVTGFTEVVK